MRIRPLSLGAKLNVALVLFLIILAAATTALMLFGFNRTRDNATATSRDGLEDAGRERMLLVASDQAAFGVLQMQWASDAGQLAARYMFDLKAGGGGVPGEDVELARSENGILYDPDTERNADVVLPAFAPLTPAAEQDIVDGRALDAIAPSVFASYAGRARGSNFDAIAFYFASVNNVHRYYPPIGVHEIADPDTDISPVIEGIGPVNNPERRTRWTTPYEDEAGQGLVMTAYTPVYEGNVLRGVIGIDLSIGNLVELVNVVKPSPGGFSFYMDEDGELLRTDSYNLIHSELDADPAGPLRDALDAMQRDETDARNVSIAGDEYIIGYAPMAEIGGGFAVVAPVDEITAGAASITNSIDDDANRTLLVTTLAMMVLLSAALVAAGYLNRRVLLRPLRQLATATRTVAGGDLTVHVPAARHDELGELASGFNVMVERLRESEQDLERRVIERTRELKALLEVSRRISSEVTTEELVQTVVRVSAELFDTTGATVTAIDDAGTATLLGSNSPALARTGVRNGFQYAMTDFGILWDELREGRGIIIDDTATDTPLAVAYRHATLPQAPDLYRDVRSWMGVPMAIQERVVGWLVVTHSQPGRYTQEHLDLALAIASQAAVALENARLFEESSRHAREMEALSRADAELFRSLSIDTVLQSLVDVAVDVLGAHKSLVTLWDRAANSASVRAARNLAPESIRSFESALPSPERGALRDDLQPTSFHRVTDQAIPEELRAIMEREGIVASMDIPIHSSAGEIIGGYGVGYTTEHTFDEGERLVLRALADRAAIALQNAELYERAQQKTREAQALSRADDELFRSLNLDHVLDALVDVAIDVLGADKSVVVLHDGEIDVVRAQRNYSPQNVIEFNKFLSTMPHQEPPPGGETPHVYTDVSTAPDFIADFMRREQVASHMSTPIRDDERMFGVFGVSFRQTHHFTPEEQSLYEALADRSVVAIKNAELYERAQQAASLEERQRLARELHDSVSQALYGIALGTRTAKLRLGDDPHNAAEPVDYVMSLAQAGLAEMRALIFELRPESLELEGVVAAIEKQVASIAARYKLDVQTDLGEEPDCALEVKEAIYRIAQEALHNIVKHAHAQHVDVQLRRDGDALLLTVRDDGRGFDPARPYPGHVGLHSMPERAHKLGGTLTIESTPGAGAIVTARIPVR